MSPETRKITLTPKHSITLSQINHAQLVMAISSADPADRYQALKPKPMEGYSHEMAMENSSGYREQWEKFESAVNRANALIWIGAAWQAAWLDMEGDSWKQERDAAIAMGEKMGLANPDPKDIIDMGGLVYALTERRAPKESSEIIPWLREGAGLLDSSAVEAERKSPESDGEQPPAPGSESGDAPKNPGGRKNPRNRGG